MIRKLQLWNGRGYGVFRKYDRSCPTVYIAAYSIADAERVCVEAGLNDPGYYEITKYWNKGVWGNKMNGISPKRGLWTCSDEPRANPVKYRMRRPK